MMLLGKLHMLSRKTYVHNTTGQYKIIHLPEKLILLIYMETFCMALHNSKQKLLPQIAIVLLDEMQYRI